MKNTTILDRFSVYPLSFKSLPTTLIVCLGFLLTLIPISDLFGQCSDNIINLPVGYRADGLDGGDTLRVNLSILETLDPDHDYGFTFDTIKLSYNSNSMDFDYEGNDPTTIKIDTGCAHIGKKLTLIFCNNTIEICTQEINILPRVVCNRDTVACNDPFVVAELFRDPTYFIPIDTCSDGTIGIDTSLLEIKFNPDSVPPYGYHYRNNDKCDQDTIIRYWSISLDLKPLNPDNLPYFCTDTTIVERINTGQIDIPSTTDTLYCSDVLGLSKNQLIDSMTPPMYDENPLLPDPGFYCNLIVAHTDTTFVDLGCNTCKIIIDWNIYDWCLDPQDRLVYSFSTSLMVLDTTPPDGFFITDSMGSDSCEGFPSLGMIPLFKLSAGVHDCSAMGNIPLAGGTDFCQPNDSVKVIGIQVIDGPVKPTTLQNGGPADALSMKGEYCLLYKISDGCANNLDTLYARIDVIDDLAPTAVCIADYNVTLSSAGGITWLDVDSLAGYFADNCGIEAVYGRRKVDWRTACDADVPDSYLYNYYLEKYQWYQMDGVNCSEEIDTGYTDYIPLCCEDAGQQVMVQILYIDQSCNTSTCWLTLHVEDKTPPTIVRPLPDIYLDCDVYDQCYADLVESGDSLDTDSLNKYFGTYLPLDFGLIPYPDQFWLKDSTCEEILEEQVRIDTSRYLEHGLFSDNCNNILSQSVEASFDNCGGWITRTFTFSNGVVRTQNIHVENRCPITSSDFDFPVNVTIDSCIELLMVDGKYGGDLDPSQTGSLQYLGSNGCKEIWIGYWDKAFWPATGSSNCFTVKRTWCVFDECVLPEGEGIPIDLWDLQDLVSDIGFKYEQLIFIEDNEPPSFDPHIYHNTVDTTYLGGSCALDGFIRDVQVTDNCLLGAPTVYWHLTNGFDINKTGSGNMAVPGIILPAGKYILSWTATDYCSNTSYLRDTFVLKSEKKPSLNTITYLTAPLTPMDMDNDNVIEDAMNTVWAAEFVRSATNACGGTDDHLIYLIERDDGSDPASPAGTDALVFNCEDFNQSPVIPVLVWVVDTMQNTFDFSRDTINLQDHHNTCAQLAASTVVVKGNIVTEMLEVVAQVDVKAQFESNERSQTTNVDGTYFFRLPEGKAITIHPKKDIHHTNGLSTLDLLKIQKHILGINPIQSPYKLIAANANDDDVVNAIDLIQLRRLLLGKIDKLPNNTSWRFVVSNHKFAKPEDALTKPYPELVVLDNEMDASEHSNFVGIKIGDINSSVNASRSESRSFGKEILSIVDHDLKRNDEIKLPISIKDQEVMAGLQLQLLFDPDAIEIANVSSTTLQLDEEMISFNEGGLRISWSSPNGVRNDNPVLELTIKVKQDVRLSNAIALGTDLPSQLYVNDQDIFDLAIEYTPVDAVTDRTFYMDQNRPNPFNGVTTIGFFQKGSGSVTLNIMDTTGKIVRVSKEYFDRGYHEIEMEKDNLPEGLMYYQIQTDYGSDTKKMILIH